MQDVPEKVDGELRIDRYVVEAKLGSGGMADVWLCRLVGVRGFTKQVVIKTIKPECRTPQYETMFVDEATIGGRLEHPNIPRVTELGQTASGVLFLVQEYVDGPSVQEILTAQKALRHHDLRLAARIVADVASALDFAFRLTDERGRALKVVHRDVSSTNILVSRRGPAKLIDFGVARFEDRESKTQTGIVKGKLRYLAPEIISGSDPGHRSDLYSLGQVLYRLCVGTRPAGLVGSADWVVPSDVNPEIDPALDAILLACLQVKPQERIPTGEMLAQRLERWILAHGGPVSGAEVSARLSALFPGGAEEWQASSGQPVPSRSFAPSKASARPRPVRSTRSLRWGAVGAGFTMSLVGLGAMWWATGAGADLTIRSAADASVENLLNVAEQALLEGRFDDAESLWRESTQIETRSTALSARREWLTSEIRLERQIRDIRSLARDDLAGAVLQAQHLLSDHPQRDSIVALVKELTAEPAAHR